MDIPTIDLFASRSAFSTKPTERKNRDYLNQHLRIFAEQWLPQAHPEMDAAVLAQPLSMVAELYPAIYLYGPQGERWLESINRCSELLDDDVFFMDVHHTFNDLFDLYGGNYRVDQGKRLESVLQLMKKLDGEQHLGGVESLVTDLFDGLYPKHAAYQMLQQTIARLGVRQSTITSVDGEPALTSADFQQSFIFFSYFYLMQDMFASNSFLEKFTVRQRAFLNRWNL